MKNICTKKMRPTGAVCAHTRHPKLATTWYSIVDRVPEHLFLCNTNEIFTQNDKMIRKKKQTASATSACEQQKMNDLKHYEPTIGIGCIWVMRTGNVSTKVFPNLCHPALKYQIFWKIFLLEGALAYFD